MKKLISTLSALFILTLTAGATDWITTSAGNYYDRNSVVKSHDGSVTLLIKYPNFNADDTLQDKTVNYTVKKVQIDCNNKQFRTIYSKIFDKNNNIISSDSSGTSWAGIDFENEGNYYYNTFCQK